MSQKDLILLKKVKESNKNAFKELFFSYHDTLFRFVLYKLQDADTAEDITQETFLRVWKTRHKLKPNGTFFSLIAKISTNLCYDHFRHVEVRQRHEKLIPVKQSTIFNQPEAESLGNSLQQEIQKIVDKDLPKKCKQVFILSRVEKLSNNEISEKLGISIRTVENQVYRAIKILRKKLKNYM
jgi:RNA polymerase sigma-70 factor (ECF subfamily)